MSRWGPRKRLKHGVVKLLSSLIQNGPNDLPTVEWDKVVRIFFDSVTVQAGVELKAFGVVVTCAAKDGMEEAAKGAHRGF